MRKRIHFNDVVARDGFQMEPEFVPTDDKVRLIDRLSACGLAKIEVTSFTSARAIPMLRDAEAVFGRIRRKPGMVYTALVPNLRGAERAMEAGVDELNVVVSISESHNLANLRMSRQRSLGEIAEILRFATGCARNPRITVSLSTAFGCPIEGDVDVEEVIRWADSLADLGVGSFTVCDTTGVAHPAQVESLSHVLLKRFPAMPLTMHFHDTRGMGLANVAAAARAGIASFDGSLGGLGGCPYAPGASGNICTEDAVHMLEAMGYDTGVDLDALLTVARELPGIVGHDISSHLVKAGTTAKPRAPCQALH
ncbi:hydroxymethylglutaryl-CoA lyase [Piscinibacter sp.]|uniref:hydroxymethylglutaryl-CoA lyase n=1 Tax=Piscinibacter sp. TaxID=1903157 RepID=UPI001DF0D515|nr:hydroxymethylglutaryl-CoA lyase [Piscinibacter sp.]MBK7531981.1 hydroxymethylglutaryl-CoA lyase [Piscinibacter sp.]MBL0093742.1 hydroxymethylglutaryl-CoA lyase [Piscinibacter sp.]